MVSETRLSAGVGEIIQFGGFSWLVLEAQKNKILVLSKNAIELRPYNKKFIDTTWETGTLRQYLNDDFYNKFNENEKLHILETKVQNNKNPWFNTKKGNTTTDKIFLLSLGEVVKYFGDSGLLSNRPGDARRIDDQYNTARTADDGDGADSWWWLRSPGFYGLNAAYVNTGGWIYVDGNNVNLYGGVRPAMWLKISVENDAESNTESIPESNSKSNPEPNSKSIPDKNLMSQINDTEEYIHLMFDAIPFSCSLWDKDLNVIDCNQAVVNLFGLTDKQEYFDRFFDLSPPIQPCGKPSFDLMMENHAKALKDGEYRLEWMHRTPDGEPMPAEVILVRVKHKNKYIVASYVRDLREINLSLSKLRESDELVQLMLDATPLCCILWNDSYKAIECNQEAVKLFNLSDKKEYLEKFFDLSPQYQPCGRPSYETMFENLSKAFRDGYMKFRWTHQKENGTSIPSEITLVRIKYKEGYIVAGYTRDLREHNKIINELEAALKQATEASKAKSDFLSAMSHEMRTPMNAIIGMTSIGKKSSDPEEISYAFNKIGESSAHLLGVINDVLDMAKIEADKLEIVPAEFNFREMSDTVMSVVSFRAKEKNQTLIMDIDDKIPEFVIGDDQRLAQVITNLTDNAIKFTPDDGQINLDIHLIEEIDDICKIQIEITDTGIGISGDQINKLFNVFEQAESGMNREYGGTGLGLVISKNIIEKMNGNIRVESECGKGSKFIFCIDVLRSDKTRKSIPIENIEHHDPANEFEGKRVLLVEDVEINREILISLLNKTGMIFECAENGKEALDMIKTDPGKYDIIFMDLQMPQMDGYEATKRIRNLPQLRGVKLPIIALSANVFTSDIEKCFAAGMNDHIGKPIDIDKIYDVLRKYLSRE